MSTLTPFILLALVLAVIGFLLGLGLGSMASGQRNPKTGPRKTNRVEVARLLRDEQTGKLIPEIGGQEYRQPGSLSAEQQAGLFKAVQELRPWLAAAEPPQPLPAVELPTASPARTGLATAAPPMPRANMNPVDVLARAINADVHVPDPAAKSIVAQIDDILQQKLADPSQAPASLQSRAIRLMELPGKGMVVMVGLDRYDSVEAVPDPAIRSLIRSCVAEWEAG